MLNNLYQAKDLFRLYKNMGMSKSVYGAQHFFLRKLAQKKFTPPRIPSQAGHGKWIFTKQQMIEIIKQFSPGGKGEWHFSGHTFDMPGLSENI